MFIWYVRLFYVKRDVFVAPCMSTEICVSATKRLFCGALVKCIHICAKETYIFEKRPTKETYLLPPYVKWDMCSCQMQTSHRRRKSDWKYLRLPKFPTSFHRSPRIYHTHFLGISQNFRQGFTGINWVPFTQKSLRWNRKIWRSEHFRSDLLHGRPLRQRYAYVWKEPYKRDPYIRQEPHTRDFVWGMAHWNVTWLVFLAVCCSVLQCVAVCCNVLQYVAVCCSVLHKRSHVRCD